MARHKDGVKHGHLHEGSDGAMPEGKYPEGWSVRVGPAGMENNISKAKGKHGMNWSHPQFPNQPGEDVKAAKANDGQGKRAVTGVAGMPKGA